MASVLTAAGLMVSGCAAGTSGAATSPAPVTSALAPSSPDLAAARRDAGIEPCPRESLNAAPVSQGLPQVTLPCLGGGRDVTLAALRGTPMLVNMWASWCAPCRQELPLLAQLHRRAGSRLVVLGVDFQDPKPAAALRLAAVTGVTYPLVADTQGQLRVPLHLTGLPTTVFVAADGHVEYTNVGRFTSYSELAKLVRDHLGVSL